MSKEQKNGIHTALLQRFVSLESDKYGQVLLLGGTATQVHTAMQACTEISSYTGIPANEVADKMAENYVNGNT